MDGRVKTLHPKIHGGLLAVLSNVEHVKQMQEHGIEKIEDVAEYTEVKFCRIFEEAEILWPL